MTEQPTLVSAELEIPADAATIFELIADPSLQPSWDGNDNLASAEPGQRIHAVGDIFLMVNKPDRVRENHIVEFEEGRLIAWKPSLPGGEPFGQLWRWELTPLESGATLVRHSYDFSQLHDEQRLVRARATTSEKLMGSIERLAATSIAM
ncbi:SRPBCC family protein [Leucobacter sp. HY1908]